MVRLPSWRVLRSCGRCCYDARVKRVLVFLVCAALLMVAWAATTEPERIVNDKYHFAFTCEASSIISYQKGGSGFTCFHQPQGDDAAKYALLVFGSGNLDVSTKAVEEAGLVGESGNVGINNQVDLDRAMVAEMKVAGHTNGGMAKIQLANGETLEVPFATWSRRSSGKTHYALNYVVLHEHKFVNVQVESEQPLSKAQVEWLTTKLELLLPELSIPTPAPGS
jgi:hypothetical protein